MAINLVLSLTLNGKDAFWNSKNTGVKLDITHLQFGTRNRLTTGEESFLNQPKQYTQIQNGSKIGPDQVRIMATMLGVENYNVNEIGLWSGVPDQAGSILIAYKSVQTGFIAQMVSGIDLVFTYDMVISTADIDQINIVKDNDQSSTFALLAAHESDRNAHPYYVTTDTVQTISGAKTFTNKAIFSGGLAGELEGNAATATQLKTARTVSFSGAATGSFEFNGSSNSSAILTLANSGVAANTYGGNLKVPVFTVNAKGLITGVSEQNIPIVDNLTTDDATKPVSAKQAKNLQDNKLGKTENAVSASKLIADDVRLLKPPLLPTGIAARFSIFDLFSNSPYGTYADTITLNTYHDNTGGFKNALAFSKNALTIKHYQAEYGATEWGIGKTLAYAEDVLSLNGGLMKDTISVDVGNSVGAFKKLIQGSTSTDGGYIAVGNHGDDKGYLELGTIDDVDSAIYARKRRSSDNAIFQEAAILDPNGNTIFPYSLTVPKIIANNFYSSTPYSFYGSSDATSQRIRCNSILASNSWGDEQYVPELGIFARGDIRTAGNVTASAFIGNASSATALATTTGSAPSYAVRAWGDIKGSLAVPAIYGGGNIANIIDNGVGNYTITFATAMPNANYSVVLGNTQYGGMALTSILSKTTTQFTVYSKYSSTGGMLDTDFNFAVIG